MNVNPVVSEILSGALRAIEEEIEDLLARVWRSPSLRDARDFSVALYDRFGRALTGRTLGAGPDAVLAAFAPETMRPGDVFLHNDAYLPPAGLGGAADLCLTRPIFAEDRLIALLQIRGRHDDLGGYRPGGTTADAAESYHEGLLIPPVRITRGEEVAADVRTLLLRNSRQPDHLADDLDAQLGALRIGALRLRDLVRRYGAEQLTACFADLLRECELAFQNELIPRLPEGSWTVETAVESDGFSGPHALRLTLRREAERLAVDLSGTGPQAVGPINCPLEGAGRAFLARLLAPLLLHLAEDPRRAETIAVNDGARRVIDVALPGPGTLVTPRFPAPCGLRALTLGRLLSAFAEALFEASGGRTPAGFDNLRAWSLWGDDDFGNHHLIREALGAGSGGAEGADGVSAVPPIGGTGGMPIEIIEARYPLRIEAAGLLPDSGGAGTHRGGLGVFRTYRLGLEGRLFSTASGDAEPPRGAAGGEPGGRFRQVIEGKGRKKERALPGIVSGEPFAAGEAVRVETPGGGGWGPPHGRDPETVRLDVVRGFVTPEAARKVYGVALGSAPGFEVDPKKTHRLREGK